MLKLPNGKLKCSIAVQAIDLSFLISVEMTKEYKNRIKKCSSTENLEKVTFVLPGSFYVVGGRIYEFTTDPLLKN